MKKIFSIIALFVVILILNSCDQDKELKSVLNGDLYEDTVIFQLAVYFLDKPTYNPVKRLEEWLSKDSTQNIALIKDSLDKGLPSITIHKIDDIIKDYAPLDTGMLKYFGYGMTDEEKIAFQNPKDLIVLNFSCLKDDVWSFYKRSIDLMYYLANNNSGIIWDEESRTCHTPKEWKRKRIDKWEEVIPNVTDHYVIHFYRVNGYCRAVTLGMRKFGLPDIALNNISCYQDKSSYNFINLLCQVLAEKHRPVKNGEIELCIDSLKSETLKNSFLGTLKKGAKKRSLVLLTPEENMEGDPYNRLLGIKKVDGDNSYLDIVVSEIFGSEDSLYDIQHDKEILDASMRAKEKLPELKKLFNKGLETNEHLLLKGPFATVTGRNEWMWVEVTKWENSVIHGILQNDPFEIPTLKAGAKVKIKQKEVFDYIHYLPDGTQKGNETGEIIGRRAAQ